MIMDTNSKTEEGASCKSKVDKDSSREGLLNRISELEGLLRMCYADKEVRAKFGWKKETFPVDIDISKND